MKLNQIEFLCYINTRIRSISCSFFPLSSIPCIFKYDFRSATLTSFRLAYKIRLSTCIIKSMFFYYYFISFYLVDIEVNYGLAFSSFTFYFFILPFLTPISSYYFKLPVPPNPIPYSIITVSLTSSIMSL